MGNGFTLEVPNGSQPGPNYTLAMTILSIGIPILLLYFPWAYDHHNQFKTIGKFAIKPRTNMIFTTFYSMAWVTCSIAMSAHANNPSHCVLDKTLQKKHGDDYTKAWVNQCNLGKAGAAFAWLTCLTWVGAWICTMIILWNEKQLIQQNIKENKQNRQTALEEDEEQLGGHDVFGGVQSQSLEQARTLHSVIHPAMMYQQQQLLQHY
ncbi:hypothetical protein BC941DRAFT_349215 [Chlamydoabsidia padenii]|nr:hypothetical protein BC941DRAFT_349215 [Chlamydoabsidia padenii]